MKKIYYFIFIIIFALLGFVLLSVKNLESSNYIGECKDQYKWSRGYLRMWDESVKSGPVKYYDTYIDILLCYRQKNWTDTMAIEAPEHRNYEPFYRYVPQQLENKVGFNFENCDSQQKLNCTEMFQTCKSPCSDYHAEAYMQCWNNCIAERVQCENTAEKYCEDQFISKLRAHAKDLEKKHPEFSSKDSKEKDEIAQDYISRDIAKENANSQVVDIRGNAYIKPDGEDKWYKLRDKELLTAGDAIKTTKGKIILIYEDATRAQVGENTQIKIKKVEIKQEKKESTWKTIYRVILGLTRFETPEGRKFMMESPTAIIGVRGTDFIVRVDSKNTFVFVLEGEVEVSDTDQKKTVEVGAGEMVRTENSNILSQLQKYREETISTMIDELKIDRKIPLWIWIIGIIIIAVLILILIKKKLKK